MARSFAIPCVAAAPCLSKRPRNGKDSTLYLVPFVLKSCHFVCRPNAHYLAVDSSEEQLQTCCVNISGMKDRIAVCLGQVEGMFHLRVKEMKDYL